MCTTALLQGTPFQNYFTDSRCSMCAMTATCMYMYICSYMASDRAAFHFICMMFNSQLQIFSKKSMYVEVKLLKHTCPTEWPLWLFGPGSCMYQRFSVLTSVDGVCKCVVTSLLAWLRLALLSSVTWSWMSLNTCILDVETFLLYCIDIHACKDIIYYIFPPMCSKFIVMIMCMTNDSITQMLHYTKNFPLQYHKQLKRDWGYEM